MSSGLMDTAPGGEEPDSYSSQKSFTNPHSKSSGQLGDPSTQTSVDAQPEAEAAKHAEDGAKSAEKIRFGQSMSENGMGGQTTGSGGEADDRVRAEGEKGSRVQQGLGGDRDMDREIGA